MLLYLKWITNKDLLNSTGNSAQCYVAVWMGWEFGGEWIHVYVWLSSFDVHLKLTTFLISFTTIENEKLKKIKLLVSIFTWSCHWILLPCLHFSSVLSLSRVRLFATPWIAACQASLSITNSRSLPKLMSIESVMPCNHLILWHPLLLLSSIFPNIRVFSYESALCIRWPKYWSFSFNISPTNEHAGLISFRMDWLDLLAVQGTLKSLPQHYSSKAAILQHSPFFIAQLSHPYMTTGKTIALTRRNFVSKVMSLLFNMLPRLVITFLPRSKHL